VVAAPAVANTLMCGAANRCWSPQAGAMLLVDGKPREEPAEGWAIDTGLCGAHGPDLSWVGQGLAPVN